MTTLLQVIQNLGFQSSLVAGAALGVVLVRRPALLRRTVGTDSSPASAASGASGLVRAGRGGDLPGKAAGWAPEPWQDTALAELALTEALHSVLRRLVCEDPRQVFQETIGGLKAAVDGLEARVPAGRRREAEDLWANYQGLLAASTGAAAELEQDTLAVQQLRLRMQHALLALLTETGMALQVAA